MPEPQKRPILARPWRSTVVLATVAAGLSPAVTPALAGSRADIPIALRIDPDRGGARVYSVPIHFGSTTLTAVIDSMSSATQILPQPGASTAPRPNGTMFSQTFGFRGAGGAYTSAIGTGEVAIGPDRGTAAYGVVTSARCPDTAPLCPIVDEPPVQARFGYDAYPASLGVSPDIHRGVAPLLYQLGVRRFILDLPRDRERGHLILDPGAPETGGFVPLVADPTSRLPNSVHGCLRNLATKIFFCGAIVLDTDQTGIVVFQQRDLVQNRDWAAGDKARLSFTDPQTGREIAGLDFTIGLETLPDVRFGDPGRFPEPVVLIGQVPYLGFRVLTDFETGRLSVSARAVPGGPPVGHMP